MIGITRKIKIIKTKTYIVDDIEYKSKTLYDYHLLFKQALKDNIITSFNIPPVIKKTKYNSCSLMIDNNKFDSLMEAHYYIYLLSLLKENKIKSIMRQVPYLLQEEYTNKFTKKKIRKIEYIADFVVTDNKNNVFVIDVKGTKTDIFKLKEKIFGYMYPDLCLKCVKWSKRRKQWLDLDVIEKEKEPLKEQKEKLDLER